MFGSYMVQMVRSNAHKLDRPLRESVLKLYKPFKWTPCFLHGFFEKILMRNKKIPVIIEFEKDCQHKGYQLVNEMIAAKEETKSSIASPTLAAAALKSPLLLCNRFYLSAATFAKFI